MQIFSNAKVGLIMKDLAGNISLGNRFSHRSWLQGKSGKHNACYSKGFSQEIADAHAFIKFGFLVSKRHSFV